MGRERECVLDQIQSLQDLQAVVEAADVDAAAVAAHLAADAAGAELVWHRRVRLQCEFDAAALAAGVKFPAEEGGRRVSGVAVGRRRLEGRAGEKEGSLHWHSEASGYVKILGQRWVSKWDISCAVVGMDKQSEHWVMVSSEYLAK